MPYLDPPRGLFDVAAHHTDAQLYDLEEREARAEVKRMTGMTPRQWIADYGKRFPYDPECDPTPEEALAATHGMKPEKRFKHLAKFVCHGRAFAIRSIERTRALRERNGLHATALGRAADAGQKLKTVLTANGYVNVKDRVYGQAAGDDGGNWMPRIWDHTRTVEENEGTDVPTDSGDVEAAEPKQPKAYSRVKQLLEQEQRLLAKPAAETLNLSVGVVRRHLNSLAEQGIAQAERSAGQPTAYVLL